MILWLGPALVIEVVQQAGDPPRQFVFTQTPGVRPQGRFHGKGVIEEARTPGVFGEEVLGSVSVEQVLFLKCVWWANCLSRRDIQPVTYAGSSRNARVAVDAFSMSQYLDTIAQSPH